MATNPQARKALLQKRRFSPQRLSQLVARRKDELPMSTEHATYTIAHESGIDISKFLSPEEVAVVRNLIAQLRATTPLPASPRGNGGGSRTKARASSRLKPTVITIANVNVENVPGLDPAHAKDAREMASAVYPMLRLREQRPRHRRARP